jgi:hypothetical protein
MPAPLTFFFAFVAVLALIGLAAWLVRRFAGNRLGANTNRGRMPRLAVIDAAAVDGRRRLVLVRRDNIEHLLMIGGPTDIVVESNIVRATHAREQLPPRVAEPLPPRIAPLPEPQGWPDNEVAKADVFELPEPPVPELASRPLRPSFGEEGRRAAPMAERRGEMIERRPDMAERRSEMNERREPPPGFPPEGLLGRPERQDLRQETRQEPRHELRGEPRMDPRPERLMPRGEPGRGESGRGEPMRNEPIMPRALRPAEPPRPAEPARPVELPKAPPMRAPERVAAPPPPPAAPPPPPPPPSPPPQQSAEANLAEMAQRLEAALRRPPGEPSAATPAATEPPPIRTAARNEPPIAAPAPAPKSSFENLEDEMASLLGRPKSSS